MKTNSFTTNRSKNFKYSTQRGFVAKAAVGIVAVAIVGTAGFLLYAKGKPASENPITQLTNAVQSKVSGVKADTQKADGTSGSAPEAASASPAVQNMPPTGSVSAPAAAASTPMPMRTAPEGMVFLTRRVTVSRDTGIASYAEGTLMLVKSKAGGKIKGSVNGVSIEVPAADTATTFRQ